MNTSRLRSRMGFTLVEAVGAIGLLALTLSAAIGSFSYVLRNDRLVVAEGELDVDSRLLIERLRSDLWSTSRDQIILHPAGSGPYEAISFPVVRAEDGIVQLDADGNIEWDATVVYHMYSGGKAPEVRRTVLSPRADLPPAQRRDQLEDIVEFGDASETHNSANARTRAIISNLVEWELNITGSQFDAHSQDSGRKRIQLGSTLMGDGDQDITFRVVGKNATATGSSRHLGIDTLTMSASGAEREGEWQVVRSSTGSTPAPQNMGGGETWSGNSLLWFSATADGNSFTLRMENDRWEERNFFATGAVRKDLNRIYVSPDTPPGTFALQLDGNGINWAASAQTRHTGQNGTVPDLFATRVLVRGTDLVDQIGGWTDFDGGWLNFNGTNLWARFNASTLGNAVVMRAFIGESVNPHDPAYAMDIVPGTQRNITFGGGFGGVWFSGTYESDRIPYMIDEDKSYLLGVYFQRYLGHGENIRTWVASDAIGVPPTTYVINNSDTTTFFANTWSTHPSLTSSNIVYGLQTIRTGHAPVGTHISQIFDTQVTQPQYRAFSWNATVPQNASVQFKLRAGAEPNLSDADPWEDVPTVANGFTPAINGRYVQAKAILMPGTDALTTPTLRDFTVRWRGEQRIVDLSGVFSTGPNHGIYEVLVNDTPLLQGVTINLTVYKDVQMGVGKTRRLTSKVFTEIVPRNTGRPPS